MSATLYYIQDPMCSWCWGYRPVWDALQENLPASVRVEYVAGGLASDTNTPMPLGLQETIKGHWKNIHATLGAPFNFDFWTDNIPRRSTYIACRAAIAAHRQGFQKEMIGAIQQAYYLRALNPSDAEVLISLAGELREEGLDLEQFSVDLLSIDVQKELERQIALAGELTDQGFPSLVLEYNGLRRPIIRDYRDYRVALADIVSTVRTHG
ncbi:DsbA family protein [bacterium]|nr:DsbA family protein [bacterium]